MAVKQRARKDEDKAQRRREILEVATSMLGELGYSGITMAEVARRCGLAKGTLYLYFNSKEELFLAALQTELAELFQHIDGLIAGPVSVEQFAAAIAGSLVARPTVIQLMSLLHNVLEQNIELDAAAAFKRELLGHMRAAASSVEAALPELPPGAGLILLLRINALVIGLQQMADPAPKVATALQACDLAPLRVDFERDFAATLADLVHGMTRR